jgi:hypothetical protein
MLEFIITRIKEIVLWACGVILIGFSVWCLHLSIRFGLWTISLNPTPIDIRLTFFVSVCVTLAFFLLMLIAGIFSFFLGSKTDSIGMLAVFRLSIAKLAILVVLLTLSVLALSEYGYTTKITVEERRGVPLSFTTVGELRVMCISGLALWKCRHVEEIHSVQLLANALMIYYSVCIIAQAWQEFKLGANLRRLTTRPYKP